MEAEKTVGLEKIDAKNEVNLDKFSEAEKKRIQDIAGQIDVTDSQALVQYGIAAQSNVSAFADTILNEVRAKDAGFAGQALTNLMLNVKGLNVESLSSEGFLANIPLIGSLFGGIKKFIAQFETISEHIDEITDELTKGRMQLLKDITLLDTLYDKNHDYLKEIELHIIAGEVKLKELREKVLPELRTKAETSKDALDAQKVQDMSQIINRFEKKVYDLKLSRMVAIQALPQIRLIQNNDQALVEKIQSSILNTIPLWKNQIVIAISLFRQKKAVELQKEVSQTTNDLLTKNSEMLKVSSIEVAKESERGIVEIETLKTVHKNLIETIEETLKIQEDGKIKRKDAEVELKKLEEDLKNKLVQIKSNQAGK